MGPHHLPSYHNSAFMATPEIGYRMYNIISYAYMLFFFFSQRKLHHPNLLMLMDLCKTKDELCLISPCINGSDLEKLVFGDPPPFQVISTQCFYGKIATCVTWECSIALWT